MKIALLNLPYDNNYGGNLQRYALMKVLQDMGYDVTHINLRFFYHLPWYKKPFSYTKRFILKYILGKNIKIYQEGYSQRKYEDRCTITEPFYQRYIKHSEPITDLRELKKLQGFDAYIVGSDQVWRKKIAGKYLYTMFLDFLPDDSTVKRIAYGVSLGVAENELNQKEISSLSEFYKRFDAVSVREDSALELFQEYAWKNPQAVQVLDPTLLLKKEDYLQLVENGSTHPSEGNLFCYILDKTDEKNSLILQKAEELHLKPFYFSIQGDKSASIEQWLRSFADAKYVITDSYHGFLFSIIFNKPFHLIKNKYRGNERFEAFVQMLNIPYICESDQGLALEMKIEMMRKQSMDFIKNCFYCN